MQHVIKYRNSELSVAERTADLLSRMTLDEKVAQLQAITGGDGLSMDGALDLEKAKERFPNGIGFWGWPQNLGGSNGSFVPLPLAEMVAGTPSPIAARGTAMVINQIQQWATQHTRLGIPVLPHVEALHGMGIWGATSLPQAIALASTWDVGLIEKCFRAVAREGRTAGIPMVLSPVMDVARDPRWGRIEETYGEDTYLAQCMAVAAVVGLQGQQLGSTSVAATVKHFAAYSKPVGGRNLSAAECGERELREVFLPVFLAAIRAGAACLMPGYNEVDGIPCHASRWLLRDVLRMEWDFGGVVVADYAAIPQLASTRFVASDERDAMRLSFTAGVDVELPQVTCSKHLRKLVDCGDIPVDDLDDAVARVLALKLRLGLFENPYGDPALAESIANCTAHKSLTQQAAEQACVLLQNRGNLLPLDSKSLRRVAIIGPNGAVGHIGGYGGWPAYVVDPLSGIRSLLGDDRVTHSQGCRCSTFDSSGRPAALGPDDDDKAIEEAVRVASEADAIILCLGENEQLCGEGMDSHDLELPGNQMRLVRAVAKLAKPTVAVLIHGRPMVIGELCESVPAVLTMWYGGQEGGHALARVLFGLSEPGGRLPVSFPRHIGAIPCHYTRKRGDDGNYIFSSSDALFPFGHGLGYTQFQYERVDLEKEVLRPGEACDLSVTIRNVGMRDGYEIVQVYLTDQICSVTRPNRQLCAFAREFIPKGEKRQISIRVEAEQFACWDSSMRQVVEPGKFTLGIGPDSRNIPLSAEVCVVG